MGRHLRDSRTEEICFILLISVRILAAAFWINCRPLEEIASQKKLPCSIYLGGQESELGKSLLSCWCYNDGKQDGCVYERYSRAWCLDVFGGACIVQHTPHMKNVNFQVGNADELLQNSVQMKRALLSLSLKNVQFDPVQLKKKEIWGHQRLEPKVFLIALFPLVP